MMVSLQREKFIGVDPVSLNQSSSNNRLHPSWLTAKSKLVSGSLPGSVCSSPRLPPNILKKWRNSNQSSSSHLRPTPALQGSQLRRCKSCGEGRTSAPPDDFDLWSANGGGSFRDPEDAGSKKRTPGEEGREGEFRCGALCMFLPGLGFGRGKVVKEKRGRMEAGEGGEQQVISTRVSLEKFECGSWASGAMMEDADEDDDDDESGKLFFDLPLELIQSTPYDTDSPVRVAFVFERDIKGVLKSSSSSSRPPPESSRHVRFSASSPPLRQLSPRLRRAREDFIALLEAQIA